MQPSLAGFIDFIFNRMQVPTTALSNIDPLINEIYNYALQTANFKLLFIPQPPFPSPFPLPAAPSINPYPSLYAIAVYNLGGDALVNAALDASGAPTIAGTNPPVKFWAYTRSLYKIDNFLAGVVQSTSDNGSSTSLAIPEMMQQLNLMDLQTLKTPWGRRYMQIAQQMGPTDWGIS